MYERRTYTFKHHPLTEIDQQFGNIDNEFHALMLFNYNNKGNKQMFAECDNYVI